MMPKEEAKIAPLAKKSFVFSLTSWAQLYESFPKGRAPR
jgi:hypothetical protein